MDDEIEIGEAINNDGSLSLAITGPGTNGEPVRWFISREDARGLHATLGEWLAPSSPGLAG